VAEKPKRIIFSTPYPNDQGSIIPNNVISFNRFNLNPVLLEQHNWNLPPLGIMTDIQLEDGKWTGVPVFHKKTQASKEYSDMYEAGSLRACSIGGAAEYNENTNIPRKTDPTTKKEIPNYILDDNGNKLCTYFDLYEISMVTLPSNPEAVTQDAILSVKVYNTVEVPELEELVTLTSNKLKEFNTMSGTKKTAEELKKAATKATEKANELKIAMEEAQAAYKEAKDEEKDDLKAKFEKAKGDYEAACTEMEAAKAELKDMEDEEEKAKADAAKAKEKAENSFNTLVLETLGAVGEQIKEFKSLFMRSKPADPPAPEKDGEITIATLAATEALKVTLAAKEKAEKEGATDTEIEVYETALAQSDEKVAALKALIAPVEDTEIPKLKTLKEIEEMTLAAKPGQLRTITVAAGTPYSKLCSDPEGMKIINRVRYETEKSLDDYRIVLESMATDARLNAVFNKVRLHPFMKEGNIQALRNKFYAKDEERPGHSIRQILAELNAGRGVSFMNGNQEQRITTLGTSTDALNSPELLMIEWLLGYAIYSLFPSKSWKKDIPVFPALETERNLGLIFTNVAADPTIDRGTSSTTTDYTYDDTAQALKLIPYFLQPMLWTAMKLHYLPTDPTATGWAQAFSKMNAVIDDEMIYTLGSLITSLAYQVPSSGDAFTIAGATDPNAFVWNPAYAGSLAKPAFNDIMTLEQIYRKQNFELENMKAVVIIDDVMEKFIAQDPDTKSLLTRWIQEGKDVNELRIKHTDVNVRSRVLLYDPAGNLAKDPYGSVDTSYTSAGLGFIPSQVGIGIGALDVFVLQDPSAYGLRMSANIRSGITTLRHNNYGVAIYYYGQPNV